jgi:hypothetical protein
MPADGVLGVGEEFLAALGGIAARTPRPAR